MEKTVDNRLNPTSVYRWSSLILCAVVATIAVLIIQQLPGTAHFFTWWAKTFNAFTSLVKCSTALLFGLLITLILKQFFVFSYQRAFTPRIKYPPLSFAVLFSLPLLFYVYGVNLISDSYHVANWEINVSTGVKPTTETLSSLQLFLFSTTASPLWFLLIGCSLIPLWHSTKQFVIRKANTNKATTDEHQQPEVIDYLQWEYEDFETWFKNDEPIEKKEHLLQDKQAYVTRIYNKLSDTDTTAHIALCGPFGSGKSSIIKCVIFELDNAKWIVVPINAWGRDKTTLSGQILTEVVEAMAEHVDMAALKSLPKQYLDALKAGNTTSKIIASFAGVSQNPEKVLLRLDRVLASINMKLLIHIEDIDRDPNSSVMCHELAALLDRLKPLNHISFIVALDYTVSTAEIIRKVCDHREDIAATSFFDILHRWMYLCAERAKNKEFKLIADIDINGQVDHRANKALDQMNGLIQSSRSMKHIVRRLDSAWSEKRLMGEIDIFSLFLLVTLREEAPEVFGFLVRYRSKLNQRETFIRITVTSNKSESPEETLVPELQEATPTYIAPDVIKDVMINLFIHQHYNNNATQKIGRENQAVDYFSRMILEQVPSGEVSDQDIFRKLNEASKQKSSANDLAAHLVEDIRWRQGFNRFYNQPFLSKSHIVFIRLFREVNKILDQQRVAQRQLYYQDNKTLIENLFQAAVMPVKLEVGAKHKTKQIALLIYYALRQKSLWADDITSNTEAELFEHVTQSPSYFYKQWLKVLRGEYKNVEVIRANTFYRFCNGLLWAKAGVNLDDSEAILLLKYQHFIDALLEKNTKSESFYKECVSHCVVFLHLRSTELETLPSELKLKIRSNTLISEVGFVKQALKGYRDIQQNREDFTAFMEKETKVLTD